MNITGTPPLIPDFTLLRIIGRGSYGEVWLALAITGVFRAVKIVRRSSFAHDRPYQREFDGVTQYARVAHGEPSQLAVLHAGLCEGYFYYVMELADDAVHGRNISPDDYCPLTLAELKQRRVQLPWNECLDLALTLAQGLVTLHRAGLVHRDIKPTNIVVIGGVPKLADIGLVTAAEDGRSFVGTELYTAPEGPGRPSADIYGLSRVLYEMYTGRDAVHWPKGLEESGTDSAEWIGVLKKAGEFLVSRRYSDALGLLEDLQLLRAGKSVRKLRRAEKTIALLRRGLALLCVVGLGVGISAAGAVMIERGRAERADVLRRKAESERDALARRTLYEAEISQTGRALITKDYTSARRHFDAAGRGDLESENRGFEWELLKKRVGGTATRVLRERGASVGNIAFDREGRELLIQHLGGGAQWLTLDEPERALEIAGVANLLAAAVQGGWWVSDTNGQVFHLDEGRLKPASLRLAAMELAVVGGNTLCALDTTHPGDVRRWVLGALQGETFSLNVPGMAEGWSIYRDAAAASADGRLVAMVVMRGHLTTAEWRVVVLELETGRVLLDEYPETWVSEVTFRANDEVAYSCPNLELVRRIQLAGGRTEVRTPGGLGGRGLSFTPDNALRWVDRMGALRVESPGEPSRILGLGKEGAVYSVSGDRGQVAGGDEQGRVLLWRGLANAGEKSVRLAVSPGGGEWVLAGATGKVVAVRDAGNRPMGLSEESHAPEPWADASAIPLGISRDESRIILAGHDGTLAAVRIADRTPVWTVQASSMPFKLGAVADLSDTVCAMDDSGKLVVVSADGAIRFSVQAHGGIANGLAISRDGAWVMTSGNDGWLRLWGGHTGEKITARDLSSTGRAGGFNVLLVSPGGDMGAGIRDGAGAPIELFELPSLRSIRTLFIEGNLIQSMDFDSSGRRLVVAGDGPLVRILSADTGMELCVLPADEAAAGDNTAPTVTVLDLAAAAPFWSMLLSDGRIVRERW